jgi:hypothetical protein
MHKVRPLFQFSEPIRADSGATGSTEEAGPDVDEGDHGDGPLPGKWHNREKHSPHFPCSYRFLQPSKEEAKAIKELVGDEPPSTAEEHREWTYNVLREMVEMSHYITYAASFTQKNYAAHSKALAGQNEIKARLGRLEKQMDKIGKTIGLPAQQFAEQQNTVGRKRMPVELERPEDSLAVRRRADTFLQIAVSSNDNGKRNAINSFSNVSHS